MIHLVILVIYSEMEKFNRRMRGCATCIITVARCDRYRTTKLSDLRIAKAGARGSRSPKDGVNGKCPVSFCETGQSGVR